MDKVEDATILIVEDDPGHTKLIKWNLQRSNISGQIFCVDNGFEAVEFLLRKKEFHGKNPALPLFVILDLNLPGMDGLQVLETIKKDKRTKHIPVIIMTTSDNNDEIFQCYSMGCNAFVTKPIEYSQFAETIYKLGQFLSVCSIPEKRSL